MPLADQNCPWVPVHPTEHIFVETHICKLRVTFSAILSRPPSALWSETMRNEVPHKGISCCRRWFLLLDRAESSGAQTRLQKSAGKPDGTNGLIFLLLFERGSKPSTLAPHQRGNGRELPVTTSQLKWAKTGGINNSARSYRTTAFMAGVKTNLAPCLRGEMCLAVLV